MPTPPSAASSRRVSRFRHSSAMPMCRQRRNVTGCRSKSPAARRGNASMPRRSTTAGASRVAVAHTRDDQAETVLLRLTRGAGTAGLAGMAPRRGPLVRPVLDATRLELQQYLRERGETWREDATNLDRTIPRNLVRHDVLPHLRTINAQADNALARAADMLRGGRRLSRDACQREVSPIVNPPRSEHRRATRDARAGRRVIVSAAELTKLPAALATRVARYALETANPSRSYGLEEAQALCAFAAGGAGGDLPGLAMERLGAKVVLGNRQVHRVHQVHQVPSVESFELKLQVPGTVEAPHGTWAVTAEGPMPTPASVDRGAGDRGRRCARAGCALDRAAAASRRSATAARCTGAQESARRARRSQGPERRPRSRADRHK